MTRQMGMRVVWAGWSLYALALFLPVVRELGQGGLQTALMSLAAIPMLVTPTHHDSYDLLLALSGLANVIIVLSPAVLLRPRLAAVAAWALVAGWLISIAWLAMTPSLTWGYFVWTAAFLVTAAGMHAVRRSGRAAATPGALSVTTLVGAT